MFELFAGKKNHFIGLDFGTTSMKIVELSYNDHKIKLENYGVVDLKLEEKSSLQQQGPKALSFEQKLNEALKKVLNKMDMSSGLTYVALPGFTGLITILELPQMQSDELAKAIQFEAHKYIPSSLDEVVMSWEIIDHVKSSQEKDPLLNNLKILLVAAPRKDVERYNRLVLGTGLEVSAIELETFSIARSLVGEDLGTFFILDIGASATNMILVEKGIVQVNRNIDAGGNQITSAIAESMGISHLRAEVFKHGEKDILNGKESAMVIPVLELIASESLRILNTYKNKNINAKIDSVILSGGTSKMKGMEEYFARILGTKVVIGNPWQKISLEGQLQTLTENLGGSFSVAIGLALRGIDDHKRN